MFSFTGRLQLAARMRKGRNAVEPLYGATIFVPNPLL
jgi:hypothetical protein